MPHDTPGAIQKSFLRQKAEKLHSERPGKKQHRNPAALVHVLEVHQIELEMQNEELQNARLEAEDSRNRYLDLYDFAPVGYLTLDKEGAISELNLTAARILGIEEYLLLVNRFIILLNRNFKTHFIFTHREHLSPPKQTPVNFYLRRMMAPYSMPNSTASG